MQLKPSSPRCKDADERTARLVKQIDDLLSEQTSPRRTPLGLVNQLNKLLGLLSQASPWMVREDPVRAQAASALLSALAALSSSDQGWSFCGLKRICPKSQVLEVRLEATVKAVERAIGCHEAVQAAILDKECRIAAQKVSDEAFAAVRRRAYDAECRDVAARVTALAFAGALQRLEEEKEEPEPHVTDCIPTSDAVVEERALRSDQQTEEEEEEEEAEEAEEPPAVRPLPSDQTEDKNDADTALRSPQPDDDEASASVTVASPAAQAMSGKRGRQARQRALKHKQTVSSKRRTLAPVNRAGPGPAAAKAAFEAKRLATKAAFDANVVLERISEEMTNDEPSENPTPCRPIVDEPALPANQTEEHEGEDDAGTALHSPRPLHSSDTVVEKRALKELPLQCSALPANETEEEAAEEKEHELDANAALSVLENLAPSKDTHSPAKATMGGKRARKERHSAKTRAKNASIRRKAKPTNACGPGPAVGAPLRG